MVGIILVLAILWCMKRVSLKLLILVAACVAYPASFLIAYLSGDGGSMGGASLSAVLLSGSVNFIIFVTTGGIIFRKKISAAIQPPGAQTEAAVAPGAAPESPESH